MTPVTRFWGQPTSQEDAAGEWFARVFDDRDLSRLTIVAAWARFGGLARLEKGIRGFRRRGGVVQMIVGIDEGIATAPGLRLALSLADEVFVLHDSSSTFHPKLYLAEGKPKARLLVGSSNLTAGGLFSNYEASLEAEFVLPDEEAEPALSDARAYIESIRAEKGICRRLDDELLNRMIADPRYSIAAHEERRPRGKGDGADDERDQSGDTGQKGAEIFGKRRAARIKVPPLSNSMARTLARNRPKAPAPSPPPSPVATWTKTLPASDAQHPPRSGSNPLGNVRLTQAGNGIDWLTWFREELFGSVAWTTRKDRNGREVETASVPFAVTIAGRSHGVVELSVDHAAFRESKQRNHATVLHWGQLGPVLRRRNYAGWVLTLQRLADGSFRLDISR